MPNNYTRQSTISDGLTITASLFNNEYNQLANAFSYSSTNVAATGHRHDGSAGEGGNVYVLGDIDFKNKIEVDKDTNLIRVSIEVGGVSTELFNFSGTAFLPVTGETVSLGSATDKFESGYFNASVQLGSQNITAFNTDNTLSANSNNHLPTQAAVKGYVDTLIATVDALSFSADSGGSLTIDLPSETLTVTGGNGINTTGSGNDISVAIDTTITDKLDGIEANADVTDATNVAAAGAVMDGDFTANGLMRRTGAGTYDVISDDISSTLELTVSNATPVAGEVYNTVQAALAYAVGEMKHGGVIDITIPAGTTITESAQITELDTTEYFTVRIKGGNATTSIWNIVATSDNIIVNHPNFHLDSLTITSTFSSNRSLFLVRRGNFFINDCTITNNDGSVLQPSYCPDAYVKDSTITAVDGDAILNYSGHLRLVNVDVNVQGSGNHVCVNTLDGGQSYIDFNTRLDGSGGGIHTGVRAQFGGINWIRGLDSSWNFESGLTITASPTLITSGAIQLSSNLLLG